MSEAREPSLSVGGELAGRYALVQVLGRGGFGQVYRAIDRERRSEVALKVLNELDPDALIRFKNEFRSLARISHPNLIDLFEFHGQGDAWFFSMPLIEGRNVLDYVSSGASISVPQTTRRVHFNHAGPADETRVIRPADEPTSPRARPRPPSAPWTPPDVERLRDCLAQIVDGLRALHGRGKLHCDIKPSNILVTPEGRVVILDFGLVTELGHGEGPGEFVSGTPSYMSPEQAAGVPLSPASDWYAVGVVLCEALTGRRPFDADGVSVLTVKQHLDPPDPVELLSAQDLPRDVEARWPADLAELCHALLARSPTDRPDGSEIAQWLERRSRPTRHQPSTDPGAPPSATTVTPVGRDRELSRLVEALEQPQRGPRVVVIRGASGMGKTTLFEAFAQRAARDPGTVILRGRCHEAESVPYPGLDAVIDELAGWLQAQPEPIRATLIPDDPAALARLFPVLKRLRAVGHAELGDTDDHTLQARALAALRQLLAKLSHHHRLVLFVDDLQWADADTDLVLGELCKADDTDMLLVVGCRADGSEIPFLQRDPAIEREELLLGPLDVEASRLLVQHEARRHGLDGTGLERALEEAGGDPFVLAELVWHHATTGQVQRVTTSLERMMQARVDDLDEHGRAMIRLVAVAGHPISIGAVALAGRVPNAEIQRVLKRLRSSNLAVATGLRGEDRLWPYHDRLRVALVDSIDPAERGRMHGELAWAMEATHSTDFEAIATHFEIAGRQDRAVAHLQRAASRAMDAFAFAKAVGLLRRAIRLEERRGGEAAPLQVQLGHALVAAGEGTEAARWFARAADHAEETERLELECAIATQLLGNGRLDEGLEAAERLLRSLGMQLPRSTAAAVTRMLWNRGQIRLRGLRYHARTESEVGRNTLLRLDAGHSVAMGLSVVDPILGACFQAENLRLALAAGEPRRIARAMAFEASYHVVTSQYGWEQGLALLERMREVADETDAAETRGFWLFSRAACHYLGGHFREAIPLFDEARDHIRGRCRGMSWELGNIQSFTLDSLRWLGRLAELEARLEPILADARRRGDVWAESIMQAKRMWIRLAKDDTHGATEDLRGGLGRLLHPRSRIQRYWIAVGTGEIELYRGDRVAALRTIEEPWGSFQRALLLTIPLLRQEAWEFRGRAAVAASASGGSKRQMRAWLRTARRSSRELDAVVSRLRWTSARAALLRAGIATITGDEAGASRELEVAANLAEQTDQSLIRDAAILRLESLRGGGSQLRNAIEHMRSQGVVCVPRMLDSIAPGRWPALPQLTS